MYRAGRFYCPVLKKGHFHSFEKRTEYVIFFIVLYIQYILIYQKCSFKRGCEASEIIIDKLVSAALYELTAAFMFI